MSRVGIITTAVFSVCLIAAAAAHAQKPKPGDKPDNGQPADQADKQDKQDKAAKPEKAQGGQKAQAPRAKPAPADRPAADAPARQPEPQEQAQERKPPPAPRAEPQQRAQPAPAQRAQPEPAQRAQREPQPRDQPAQRAPAQTQAAPQARVQAPQKTAQAPQATASRGQAQQAPQAGPRNSQPRRQEMVVAQQQRLTQYRDYLGEQQRVVVQETAPLQQSRPAQYRLQTEYVEYQRQQHQRLSANDGHPDYDRDLYFQMAPIYRYSRGGRSYEINEYAAARLRRAVNAGYRQGFRTGQADRMDHWRSSYNESWVYRDGSYGYDGYYIDRDEYSYYFREGFRRGYEDGFTARYRYGQRTANGSRSILGVIIVQILGFHPIR